MFIESFKANGLNNIASDNVIYTICNYIYISSKTVYLIMNDKLFNAIRNGDIEMVVSITTAHPELINIKDQRGSTPLLLATYYGNQDMTEALLAHKPDLNAQDGSGNTALMGVCFKGYPVIAKLLIDHGADVNAQNLNGATALIYAATFAQAEIAQMLIDHGADTTHTDEKGNTAYDHAKMQDAAKLMGILKNK